MREDNEIDSAGHEIDEVEINGEVQSFKVKNQDLQIFTGPIDLG